MSSTRRSHAILKLIQRIERLATPLRDPEPLRQIVQEMLLAMYFDALQQEHLSDDDYERAAEDEQRWRDATEGFGDE